jgi:hypothetical protein
MINSDTGWYKCDFTQASNSPFGLGAGCDFVNENCIVDEMVPDYGKGFFCNEKKEKKWTCGPSHMFRGTCDLEEYSYPQRTYFEPEVSWTWLNLLIRKLLTFFCGLVKCSYHRGKPCVNIYS